MVGIGLTFYGSSNHGVQKEAALVYTLFFVYENGTLKIHQ